MVDWIDVFTRKRYKDIVINSFEYCQREKGMVIYSYVIMGNHACPEYIDWYTILQSEKED